MRKFTLLAGAGVLFAVSQAQAGLVINLNFGSFDSTAPSGFVSGGGTPSTVVRAAADYWQAAYANSTTNLTHTIAVTWGPETGSTLATGGTSWFLPSGNLTNGSLNFDNDGSSNWFVDATPWDNSEWTTLNSTSADLGGGSMNVQRRYTGGNATASTRADMLSVAIHEIGHALGLLGSTYPRWSGADTGSDNDIDLTAPRQYAGAQLPALDGHFTGTTLANTVMAPSITIGQRKLLSEADILLLGQIQNFDNINLNPTIVPEPATAGVFAVGALGLLSRRKRR